MIEKDIKNLIEMVKKQNLIINKLKSEVKKLKEAVEQAPVYPFPYTPPSDYDGSPWPWPDIVWGPNFGWPKKCHTCGNGYDGDTCPKCTLPKLSKLSNIELSKFNDIKINTGAEGINK